MARISHLKALQALESVLRLGSLRDAARELAVTPAALGQRIKSLEAYLGYELLQRGGQGARPTAAALEVAGSLGRAFDTLDAVADQLQYRRPNTLYLQVDSKLLDNWLAPRLEAFTRDNPQLDLCINDAHPNPDASIVLSDNGHSGTALFRDYYLPVATPFVREHYFTTPSPAFFEGQALIHLDDDTGLPGWQQWFDRFGERSDGFDRGARYVDMNYAICAVRDGAGALLCGAAMIEPDLVSGWLQPLLPVEKGLWCRGEYRLMASEPARAQLARFTDWLQAESQRTQEFIAQFLDSR